MAAHATPGFDPEFAAAVRDGLARNGQKELPSRYLYDAVGSALFEAITHLPEYGLTRADERLLARHSADVLRSFETAPALAELGSGTGRKTRWILEAAAARGRVDYCPIDISPTALAKCRQELSAIAGVRIFELAHSYLEGLREAALLHRSGRPLLVLFLGSTIGNFDRAGAERFLRGVRQSMREGDGLLLGADLLQDPGALVRAYDDAAGVTAAFNRNILARINRELAGDFDLARFAHEARFNSRERRIEMHLVSKEAHEAGIAAAGLRCAFRKGETIWTEACHKFEAAELNGMACRTGFALQAQWIDEEWPLSENLWIAA